MHILYDVIPNAGITQDITIKRSIRTRAIRAGLVKGGTLDGDVTLSILDGATTLASDIVTAAEINNLGTYSHGFFRFDIEAMLGVIGGTKEYQLKIVYDGTESDTNYIGWKRAYADSLVLAYGSNQTDGVPINDTFSPYEIEFYRWR